MQGDVRGGVGRSHTEGIVSDWGGGALSSSRSAAVGEESGDEGDGVGGGEFRNRGSLIAVAERTGLGGGGNDVALPVPPARALGPKWPLTKLAPEAALVPVAGSAPPGPVFAAVAAAGVLLAAPTGDCRSGDGALSLLLALSLSLSSLLDSVSLAPLMLPSRIRSSREGRALSRGRSPSMRARCGQTFMDRSVFSSEAKE